MCPEGERRISVAMTTYNGEKYLSRQLESIMNQTIIPSEIVICDDGSTDNTIEIIRQFQGKYPGIIELSVNSERLGSTKNFERAIMKSSGDVIFLSDQDDVWQPEKIAKMFPLLQASSRPIGVFSNSTITDSELNPTGMGHWQNRGFSNNMLAFLSGNRNEKLSIFLRRVPCAGHDMAFCASLKDILLPFPDLPECHDTWIGMVLATLNAWAFTSEELTLFRQHKTNVSQSGKKQGLAAQWQTAKASVRNNTFSWNAKLYGELLERVSPLCSRETAEYLSDRQGHSATRAAMSNCLGRRLPLIAKELYNGRYFRYARGWKSIIQDLLLRG
ncbi:MAG: glycosyltransferase family 2 protein [Victivallaceae bacterium]|nr:glycosyltransferase family 2 protein [Victivallaceae bacterium]